MAAEWFCQVKGRQLGPLTVGQLRAMAQQGHLRPQDLVRRGRTAAWVPAERVPGLFSPEPGSSAGADSQAPAAPQPVSTAPADSQPGAATGSPAASTGQVPASPESPSAQGGVAGKRPPRRVARAARRLVSPAAGSSKPVNALGLPVAQPAPTPSVPPRVAASRIAPGVAPLGPAAPPAVGPLSASGQTTVAARGVSGQTTLAARASGRPSHRRKDNSAWVVVALVVLVLVLAVTGIGVYLWRASSWSSGAGEQIAASNSAAGALSGLEQGVDQPPGTSAGQSGPAAPTGEQSGSERWVDASREPARAGDVTVKIHSAVVERPRVLRGSGRAARPAEPYLVLRLQLENLREGHKLDYTTWGAPKMWALGVQLSDNLGNTYDPKSFTGGTIEGQLGPDAALYPREPVSEVLVFERPVESPQLEYLRLELPAMAFGGSGKLRIQIPAAMIQRAAEPNPESAPDVELPTGEEPSGLGPRAVEEPSIPAPPRAEPRGEQSAPMPGDDEPDIFRDYPELQGDAQTPAGDAPKPQDREKDDAPGLVPARKDRHEPGSGERSKQRSEDPFGQPPLGDVL